MIIETCPKCGGELKAITICTVPPIPRRECVKCGWSWEGKRERVFRIPFKPPEEDEWPITEFQSENESIKIEELKKDNLTSNPKPADNDLKTIYAKNHKETKVSIQIPNTSKLANKLGEHFSIPCDLCREQFGCEDCPEEITTCNGKKHWRMLVERILGYEEN